MFTQCCIFYLFIYFFIYSKQINEFEQIITGVSNRQADWNTQPSAQNRGCQTQNEWFLVVLMEKFLTRMSSFPLSSRVQYVLGPLPSTRVCVQVILFSVSHVTRLCGQLQSNGSLLKMHFFIYIYSRPTLKKKKVISREEHSNYSRWILLSICIWIMTSIECWNLLGHWFEGVNHK